MYAAPAAATFSLSSKITRSASFLPIPGIETSTAWSCCMIASWSSAAGREPTIAIATFGPTPVTVSSSPKNPSSSTVRNPYSAWSVLADDVVGEQLQPAARRRGGEHRRRGVDAVPDAADLDDERIEGDRRDGAVERGDHEAVCEGGHDVRRGPSIGVEPGALRPRSRP